MQLTVEGAATRLEGPLLFLRRTLDVGLQDAVEVRGSDGRPRLGRVAAIDEQFLTVEVLESTAGMLTLPRCLGRQCSMTANCSAVISIPAVSLALHVNSY